LLRANPRSGARAIFVVGGFRRRLATWRGHYALYSLKRIFAYKALAACGWEIAACGSALLRSDPLAGTGVTNPRCSVRHVGVNAFLALTTQTFAAGARTVIADCAALYRTLIAV